ncbi:hypothetical protein AA0120_g7879 [Alternaria tenuissima]|nr:hypothetical protein AA0120_g7879 [Alternaria tenuissima]
MPALPISTHATTAHHGTDWPLLWIIIGVTSIILFQTFIAVALIRWANLRSKARWKDLRNRGIAILDGHSLIWRDTIPPAPTVSTYNLRHKLQISNEQVSQ